MESTTKTPDQIATLLGTKNVVAKFKDGTSKIVTILSLPVRKYPDLLRLMDDEPAKIELATVADGLSEKWTDGLTAESHGQLLAVVEELNSTDFFAWLRRRVQRTEQLVPGSAGELGKALLSHSPDGSQTARSVAV